MSKHNQLHHKQLSSLGPGIHYDGNGLQLNVEPTGSARWIYRFQLNKRRRQMGLGSLRDVTLSEAREKRDEYRKWIKRGIDPIEELSRLASERQREAEHAETEAQRRRDEARRELERKSRTFTHCAAAFIRAHRRGWKNRKHGKQWVRSLKTYARPKIGKIPVSDRDNDHVLSVVAPIWNEKNETANRVRNRIENILDYAASKKWREPLNPARWAGHLEYQLISPSKLQSETNYESLPYAEVPAFFKELSTIDSNSSYALRLLILTNTRTSEVLQSKWDEFDLENAIWTIPANRMKAGKQHEVPLSDEAISVLRTMRTRQIHEYVFPGQKRGRPLSNMALLKQMRAMGYGVVSVDSPVLKRGDAVPHGFRSSFREWAADETHAPREVIEHAMAHKLKDKAEASYHRGTMFPKRRELMTAWGDYCAFHISEAHCGKPE